MRFATDRPIGVVLCTLAAIVFAAPTLFLPADSSVTTKLVFITGGTILFALGVVRVRQEKARPQTPDDRDDLTPE